MQAISPGVWERDIISLGAWPWVTVQCGWLAMPLLLPPPRDTVIYYNEASYVHFLTIFRMNTPSYFFSSSFPLLPLESEKKGKGQACKGSFIENGGSGLGVLGVLTQQACWGCVWG